MLLHPIRTLILGFLVFMYSGAFVSIGLIPIPEAIVNALALIFTILLILPELKPVLHTILSTKLIFSLVVLALLSSLWALSPDLTFRRAILLCGASLLGLYISMHYSLRDQAGFYARLLIVAMLSSVLVSVLFPAYGVHQTLPHINHWRGILLHKNILGEWVGLAALIFLLISPQLLQLPRFLTLSMVVLAGFLLIMSLSLTSFAACLLVIIAVPILKSLHSDYRLRGALIFYFVAAMILLAFLLSQNYLEVLEFVGRTDSLAGRATIWPVIVSLIEEQPLLGYGYMSLSENEVTLVARSFHNIWKPEHAHNIWLDMMLDMGLPGLILLVMIMLRAFWQIIVMYSAEKQEDLLLAFLLVMNFLARSMFENFAIQQRDLPWIMFVSVLVSLHRAYQKHQSQPFG